MTGAPIMLKCLKRIFSSNRSQPQSARNVIVVNMNQTLPQQAQAEIPENQDHQIQIQVAINSQNDVNEDVKEDDVKENEVVPYQEIGDVKENRDIKIHVESENKDNFECEDSPYSGPVRYLSDYIETSHANRVSNGLFFSRFDNEGVFSKTFCLSANELENPGNNSETVLGLLKGGALQNSIMPYSRTPSFNSLYDNSDLALEAVSALASASASSVSASASQSASLSVSQFTSASRTVSVAGWTDYSILPGVCDYSKSSP